jgi:hypothetical protein
MIARKEGGDHAYFHSQFDLPRIPKKRCSRHFKPGWTAMTEIVTGLLAFFSVSVFLAHAYDAYRESRWTES